MSGCTRCKREIGLISWNGECTDCYLNHDLDDLRWSTLACVAGAIGRFYALRCALSYDLSDLPLVGPEHSFPAGLAAARMRRAIGQAWTALR